jgi:chemotaxis signal transduction protein
VSDKAAQLRQEFDRSFAAKPLMAAQEVEALLAIQVAGDAYAIRLSEITGIITGRKLVAVPATAPHFVGVSGIRGGIVPVFSLASLLGRGHHAPDSLRWLVLCGTDEPIALGFSAFAGYLRVPKSALHSDEKLQSAHKYVDAVLTSETGLRAVLSLSLVVANIRNHKGK